MTRIKVLDENLVNKIAAGEVVERPASIVKELIENSIDAKADHIILYIEGAGIKKINIIDNGSGIERDDFKLAFTPHATSKIKEENDLENIKTLGFRGEALSSIASVSKVRIISKTENEDLGYEMVLEGGTIKEQKETAFNTGTSITIEDLFFNTPARRKFLKSENTEYSYIQDIFIKSVLAHPQIHFQLYNNNREVMNFVKDKDINFRVQKLLGLKQDDFIEVNFKNSISISGIVGKAHIGLKSRNKQYIFVNNRPIENNLISKAVAEGYPNFLMNKMHPAFVLFISLPADKVDVNVHPRKTEVKFQTPNEIFMAVKNAVNRAFYEINHPLTSNIYEKDTFIESFASSKGYVSDNSARKRKDIQEALSFTKQLLQNDDYRKSIEESKIYDIGKDEADNGLDDPNVILLEDNKTFIEKTLKNENSSNIESDDNEEKEEENVLDTKTNFRKLEQFLNRYIVSEEDQKLVIYDQHAAAERVLYEQYLNEIENNKIPVQHYLIPLGIPLHKNDIPILEENLDTLEEMGIDISVSGEDDISINALPFQMESEDIKNFIEEILEIIKETGKLKSSEFRNEFKERIAASLACHSAIKFGDKLTQIEMNTLLNDLNKCKMPFTCPHGRPVKNSFSLGELEKMFKRK